MPDDGPRRRGQPAPARDGSPAVGLRQHPRSRVLIRDRRHGRRQRPERARRGGRRRAGRPVGARARGRSRRSAAACARPGSRCPGSGTTCARPCTRPRLASPVFRKLGLLDRDRVDRARGVVRAPARRRAGRHRVARPRPHRRRARRRRPRVAPPHRAAARPAARRRRLHGLASCCACRATRSRRSGSGCAHSSRARRRGTSRFSGDVAPALFTGVVAHAAGGMPSLASAGAGLLLAMHAHGVGWGFPKGGSQVIADALADELVARGGEIVTDAPVRRARAGDAQHRAWCCSTPSPELLLTADLPRTLRARAAPLPLRLGRREGRLRARRTGAVDEPRGRRSPRPCTSAAAAREIAAAENAVQRGRPARRRRRRPAASVRARRPSRRVADPSRAPAGKHVLWAYTHVPAGSTLDATELVTREVERFAPGFRDLVLALGGSARPSTSRRTTRTTSAATSTRASSRSRSS